jgi:predicted nucleotidyltransferase
MRRLVQISTEQLRTVRSIIQRLVPTAEVWVFGSRIHGPVKPFSDLDLAVDAGSPLPLSTLGELRESFDEADLPFKVDIVDVRSCDSRFRETINAGKIALGAAETAQAR